VRVLAVSTATRTPFFPDVPTAAEQGVADFDLSGWVALLGPKGMAAPLTERLYALVRQAFDDATLKARFAALGIEPDLRPSAALAEAMARENRIWAAAAAAGHITAQ
jgi:tripartite-type tricarboxylate transporter receptor subunit TctC